MAKSVTNPSGLTREQYDALDSDGRYTLWVLGDVPAHWYGDHPDDDYNHGVKTGQLFHGHSCRVQPRTALPVVIQPTNTNTKRQATVWRPVYESQSLDWCHRTLIQVEDAIREQNPELAKTQRLIPLS